MSAYEHYEKKRYIALAACVAGIAVLARKNTWIILIGVGIYAVLVCLKKKKGQYLLAGFAILLTAALTVKAVDVMYEYRSGYPSDIGIPSILWIAMGLQETDGMAGCTIAISKPRLQNMIFNRSLPHRKERNIFENDCGSSGESGYGQRFL